MDDDPRVESSKHCPDLPAIANGHKGCMAMAYSVNDLRNFFCSGKGDQRIKLNTTVLMADLLRRKSKDQSAAEIRIVRTIELLRDHKSDLRGINGVRRL